KHKEALNIIEGLSEGRYKISDNARSVSVEVYTMPDILSDANTIDEYIISPESQSYIIVSENMIIPLCTKCVDLCSTGIYREEGGDYRSIYCKACCSDDMKMDDCPICMTNKIEVRFDCHHLVCKHCMIQQWKENIFICPTCRRKSNIAFHK